MNDELEVLKLVAARLEAAAIPYMVSGSVALAFYAEPRMTRDVDIVVDLGPGDLARVLALFGADFYCPERLIEEALRRRTLFNLIHTERLVKVDFIVRKDDPYRREEMARRRRMSIGGCGLSVVAPEDLLLSKLVWTRGRESELQLADVRLLVRAVPGLDRGYVRRWAGELGVEDLVDRALGEP